MVRFAFLLYQYAEALERHATLSDLIHRATAPALAASITTTVRTRGAEHAT
jgi:hypothetical protein